MARLPRLAIAGRPHLVVQRTFAAQPAFIDDDDRSAFLAALRACTQAAGVAIHAWRLADQQLRLLAPPSDAGALGRLMQALGRLYVARFNRRHGRRGTLWDGRFRATVIDEATVFLDAMRWIEAPSGGVAAD